MAALHPREVWLMTVYARSPCPRAVTRISAQYHLPLPLVRRRNQRLMALGLLLYHASTNTYEPTEGGLGVAVPATLNRSSASATTRVTLPYCG